MTNRKRERDTRRGKKGTKFLGRREREENAVKVDQTERPHVRSEK